nr:MAG TPA: hypothetical protein [Caudoviricetes sp.]
MSAPKVCLNSGGSRYFLLFILTTPLQPTL